MSVGGGSLVNHTYMDLMLLLYGETPPHYRLALNHSSSSYRESDDVSGPVVWALVPSFVGHHPQTRVE